MQKHIGFLIVVGLVLFGYLAGLVRDGYKYREINESYVCDLWKDRSSGAVTLAPQ